MGRRESMAIGYKLGLPGYATGGHASEYGSLISIPPPPCECAEERRARRNRARACLSRRRVCTRPRLDRAPQVARSAAEGRRHQGRLLFAYFLLAKQEKVSRPPRRQSGIRTHQRTRRFNQVERFPQAEPDPSIRQYERRKGSNRLGPSATLN